MAGLLGFTLADLSGAVDSRKRQYANLVRGLLSDPGATLAQLAAVDAEAARGNRYTQMSAGSVMPEVAQQGQEAMLNAALNVGGLLGITAYHGSPHTFDKFDMSKIGTGEGAQAYGHGLYFAENPQIANSYRENLSDRVFSVGGKELLGPTTKYGVADPSASRANLSQAEKMATYAMDSAARAKSADPARDAIAHLTKYGKGNQDAKEAISLIKQWNLEGAKVKQGALYKVDIPDEAVSKMLDWDKPLSQQPDVLSYLQKNIDKLPRDVKVNVASGDKVRSSLTGADLYRKLAGTPDPMSAIGPSPPAGRMVQGAAGAIGRMEYDDIGQRGASSLMRSLGIPGIRYLDAGSRGKGGTSNFVLFDDNLPKILSRE